MKPKQFYDGIRTNKKIKSNMYAYYKGVLTRRLEDLRKLYKNEADFNKKQLYKLEADAIKHEIL